MSKIPCHTEAEDTDDAASFEIGEYACPHCGKRLLRLPKTDGSYFWGCSAYEADGTGCDYTLNDSKGKPLFRPPVSAEHLCRSCGAGLQRRPAAKKKNFWWGCSAYPRCRQNYPDTCDESGEPAPDYARGWHKQ